jgi:hypothetical protein
MDVLDDHCVFWDHYFGMEEEKTPSFESLQILTCSVYRIHQHMATDGKLSRNHRCKIDIDY